MTYLRNGMLMVDYHIILLVDRCKPKKGIKELRYIDPTKLRKVKEIEEEEDPKTGAKLIKSQKEFFIFQDNAMWKIQSRTKNTARRYCLCYIWNVRSSLEKESYPIYIKLLSQ